MELSCIQVEVSRSQCGLCYVTQLRSSCEVARYKKTKYDLHSGFLTGTIAQAVQPAIHDVTDGSVMRSWLNSPLSSGLEQDVYKATNILHSFAQVGSLQPEKGIPAAVLQGAAGFAILSVVKVTVVSCYGCMQ